MYNRIMIPLDGSRSAEGALATGAELARRSDATLYLTNVVAWLAELTDLSTPGSPRRYLNRVAKRLTAGYGIRVEVILLSDAINGVAYGEPPRRAIAEVLDEYVTKAGIDLTVMTTHGKGGFRRMWLGSVADSMLRMSNASILMLKPVARARNMAPIMASRVLIPVDVQDPDEELLARAIELGERFDARYTLLHVASPELSLVPTLAPPRGEEAASAESHLGRLAGRIADAGYEVSAAVVTMPFVASEILAYADEHQFDVIAVSTHGSSALKRAMLGSVADKIIRGARLPVLACNTSRGPRRGTS